MTDPQALAVALIAEDVQIPAAQVGADTALGVAPEWDSLAHMGLILLLEARIGRQLAPEAIVSIASVEDVARLLPNHTELH